MFNNQTEKKVLDSYRRAKFNEELLKMERASKEIDYYNNDQMSYTKEKISELRVDKTSLKYATYYPLTQQIIDEISIMFSSGIDYELDYDNDETKNKNNELLSTLTDEVGLLHFLTDLNCYTNLNGDCGVLVEVNDNNPRLRLVTRDLFFVEQNEHDPTQVDAVYIFLNPFEQTPNKTFYSGYYTKITKDTISEVSVNFNDGSMSEIETSIQENTLGFIPFIIFNKQTPINGCFSRAKNPLPELNLQVNLEISRLYWIEEFQAFSTLVLTNTSKPETQYGANKVLILNNPDGNQSPDAKFISPNVSFTELDNVIVNHMQRAGQLMGIGSSAYKEGGTFNSGYQLRLSKEDIVRLNEKQKYLYEKKTKELIKMLIKVNNLFSNNNIDETYNKISIDILKPVFDVSNQEKEESYSRRIALNLTSPIEIISTEEDISYDEAKEKYLKILEDNKLGKETSENILASIGNFEG